MDRTQLEPLLVNILDTIKCWYLHTDTIRKEQTYLEIQENIIHLTQLISDPKIQLSLEHSLSIINQTQSIITEWKNLSKNG